MFVSLRFVKLGCSEELVEDMKAWSEVLQVSESVTDFEIAGPRKTARGKRADVRKRRLAVNR